MASRLDKLFDLLESNNLSIRTAAAVQIGKISANNQVQLPSLLNKLLPYVKHKTWPVRIAAADAVKHIGINTKLWVPITNACGRKVKDLPGFISLEKLNLLEILKIGTRLYSTDAKELDEINIDPNANREEISRHLGFIIPDECEIRNILNNEDYEIHKCKEERKISVEMAVEQSLGNCQKPSLKRPHLEIVDANEPEIKISCIKKEESIIETDEQIEWPWTNFCDDLLLNLWNAKWEIRHGAATCLRELVRSQGSIMICKNGNNLSRADYSEMHVRYQEEVVARLLCTLALDQLSDFVSDEMVAPVRESCAQVLGVISVHLPTRLVEILTNHLLSLLDYSEWTVNHGGLLGLKYVLAARLDLADVLLPMIYDPISSHLRRRICDDDVRCAAAVALMPIFSRTRPIAINNDQMEALCDDLWNVLSVRSDCTTSGATGAVLQLLEKLYNAMQRGGDSTEIDKQQMEGFINRLHWCYYSYSDSVRLGAVRTCGALLRFYAHSDGDEGGGGLEQIGQATILQVLSQLLQRVLIDGNVQVTTEAANVWCWLVNDLSSQMLAQISLERLDVWMCCAMQPARLSYTNGLILMPNDHNNDAANDDEDDYKHLFSSTEFYIAGRESFVTEGTSLVREDAVLKARLSASQLLAKLCKKLSNIPPVANHILITILAQIHLKERLANQRFVAAMILAYWSPDADWLVNADSMLTPLRAQLLAALDEPIYYQELLPVFKQMLKSCRDLIRLLADHNIALPPCISVANSNASSSNLPLNVAQCQALVNSIPPIDHALSTCPALSCARTSVDLCAQQNTMLSRLVEISLGRALLEWKWLPTMLTPFIKPLMDAVRCETRSTLQNEAAIALSELVVEHSATPRLVTPLGKLVKNLIQYQSDAIDSLSLTSKCNLSFSNATGLEEGSNNSADDVVTIIALQRTSQFGRDLFPSQEEVGNIAPTGVGNMDNESLIKLRGSRLALEHICRRILELSVTNSNSTNCDSLLLQAIYHQPMMHLMTSSAPPHNSNALLLPALRAMNTCLPLLLSLFTCTATTNTTSITATAAQSSNSLHHHHSNNNNKNSNVSLIEYANALFLHGLSHIDPVIRHWSARVLAILVMPSCSLNADPKDPVDRDQNYLKTATHLLDHILLEKSMRALDSLEHEQLCYGVIELLYLVIHRGLLQYRLAIVVIVLPVVLRCLNAPFDPVRRVATHIFSLALSLLPLESASADLRILTPARQQQRVQHLRFIDGLLNPDSISLYSAHQNHVTATLRHYQQQGVNWLSFLNRYGLHGVLADDMGLGKTLQTICIIVGEYISSAAPETCPPSLVVCPATLTAHWHREISRHVSLDNFSSIVYTGSIDARQTLLPLLHRYQVVITSYDILRNDIDRLARPYSSNNEENRERNSKSGATSMCWNYVVLDEGHLIRNYKSKIAIATKSICARHRLVLTGTPIQNRVAELWSLFDFLMPGLLGTHSEFHKRYGRLLDQQHQQQQNGKQRVSVTVADSESAAGTTLDQLHRQVLPFILRRIKDDVLHELPPKIMQDYICTMTPLQARLYSHCIEAQGRSEETAAGRGGENVSGFEEIETEINAEGGQSSSSSSSRRHVFQAMHYLRLVCNHPSLALCPSHPLYQSIKREYQSIDDINLSGKLVALKQLILDCGVGVGVGIISNENGNGNEEDKEEEAETDETEIGCDEMEGAASVVSNHRLLVFCQSRSMLELVERMLRTEIPKASHLRLDGSIPIKDRQSVVDKFNNDASIDLLLLTTSVGGLGLNLTSADVVIFVEHDWNPMRDLQAMDRAHRIGQKHTVNVYRLITADSIEEKIMNLQKFKLFIANTVVSSDNKQMGSMNTENLLDIMNKEAWVPPPSSSSSSSMTNQSSSSSARSNPPKSGGLKSVLSKLDDRVYECLEEYNEEYNLDSFVQKL